MTNSQKLALRLSEVRQKLNELLAIDDPNDEQRAELAQLSGEYPGLETQYRAAVIAESEETERRAADDDAQSVEYRQLVDRVELGAYLIEAATGRPVDGAEQELRAEVFGDDARQNLVPWEALLPRDEDEDRADSPVNIGSTSGVGVNQQTILARVFADTAAMFAGVTMPNVGIGASSYPVFKDSATAELTAKGTAKDAEAATITAKVLNPTRLTARYVLRVEDANRLMGLEESLRADLHGTLGEQLDKQIIAGDGTSPNFAGFFDDGASISSATTPSAQSKYEDVAVLAANAIDGKYCRSAMGARLLFNITGIQRASALFPQSGGYSAADYLAEHSGGIMASAHAPVKASKKSKILTYRMDRGAGSAVCPVWQGLEIIRDQFSGAMRGAIALTAIALHSFAILRTDAYYIQEIQEDA